MLIVHVVDTANVKNTCKLAEYSGSDDESVVKRYKLVSSSICYLSDHTLKQAELHLLTKFPRLRFWWVPIFSIQKSFKNLQNSQNLLPHNRGHFPRTAILWLWVDFEIIPKLNLSLTQISILEKWKIILHSNSDPLNLILHFFILIMKRLSPLETLQCTPIPLIPHLPDLTDHVKFHPELLFSLCS